jgi:fatty-acyl-CoA synthase
MHQSVLYRRLRDTAVARADRPAMTFLRGGEETSWTYEALFSAAEEIGEKIRLRGVEADAPLGLLLQSQEAQVLHYLGALHAGAVPAVLTAPNRKLNLDYYRETMDAVLRRCAFAAVVSDVPGLPIPGRALEPDTLEEAERPAGRDPGERGADGRGAGRAGASLEGSFLQFSSGTTGIKRGVLVRDEAVLAQLDAYAAAVGLAEGDCIVSWLPLYHDMGFIACLNMPLAFGVHTVMIDPVDWVTRPALFLQCASRFQGTHAWHPNFAYQFMADRMRDRELEGVDLSSMRALVNCSEPVTHEAQEAFFGRYRARGLRSGVFKGCYAMAETTFALTHGEPDHPRYLDPDGPLDDVRSPSAAGYVSVGRPLPGVELRVVDPDGLEPLPERRVGEIWVKSPFNFSGYFNDPEATEKAVRDGWYRTGDLGYRAGDAWYVAGRLKDVLIVGGANVFPQDIEDLVSRVEGVRPGRVSAFSAFDRRLQTERVVILAEAGEADVEGGLALRQEIRQRVRSAFDIASFDLRLVPPGWLVKSTAGKMARSANRKKWLAHAQAQVQEQAQGQAQGRTQVQAQAGASGP